MNTSLVAGRGRPIIVSGQPSFERPDSQLVTASQIYEDSFAEWSRYFRHEPEMDRKVWEYAYVLQAVTSYADLSAGAKGLCFGAGKELLPALFAKRGCRVVATDLVPDISDKGWEARGIDDLFHPGFIDRESFDRQVSFRNVDMNAIDPDLKGFDFLWSTGALEHIGGYDKGLKFIENAMRCLRPGGIAVHTTEFTLTSETKGRDHPDLSFYCRKDIEAMAMRLLAAGHMIVLNFDRGDTLADSHVDVAPYNSGRTLNAHFLTHVITSIGLIIQKDSQGLSVG